MTKNKKSNANARRAQPKANQAASNKTGRQGRGGPRGRSRRGGAEATVVRHGLNAFSPVHIPLPISTGKYHTIRSVRTFPSTDYLVLLGPQRSNVSSEWRTGVALAYPTSGTAMNAATVRRTIAPNAFPSSGAEVECTPAAFSVQVTCNTSLLNAAGVTRLGRLKSAYAGPETTDTRTAADFANALLSYAPCRQVTNAELVERPKQVNAIPTNMTELQEFTTIIEDTDLAAFDWSSTGQTIAFGGFAPIAITNPTNAELQITVCTEWRVRLDPFNPMYNSGTTHAPTHPGVWHAITSAAENASHGVEEVAGAAAGMYALSQARVPSLIEGIGSAAMEALPALESFAPLLAMAL